MAARRLLIVMLVLLGISILGGTLLPAQRNEDRTETTETVEEKTTVRDKVPQGKLLRQSLRVSPDRVYKLEIALGDQLLLTVHSKKPDQVVIPRLGLTETVDRYTPALFDILPTGVGDYPIRLLDADRTIGTIAVSREKPR